jgi:hypothetical protein
MRVVYARWSLALALFVPGCSATPVHPSVLDVSGAWVGEVTLNDFDDGECLAQTFHDIAGLPGQFHANLTQTGERVTAAMDIDHTGALCTFEGTLNADQLTLTGSSCTGTKTVALACANGALRGLLPRTESLRGTVGVNRIDGSAVENDNVVLSGTENSVGRFTGRSSFVLMRP